MERDCEAGDRCHKYKTEFWPNGTVFICMYNPVGISWVSTSGSLSETSLQKQFHPQEAPPPKSKPIKASPQEQSPESILLCLKIPGVSGNRVDDVRRFGGAHDE